MKSSVMGASSIRVPVIYQREGGRRGWFIKGGVMRFRLQIDGCMSIVNMVNANKCVVVYLDPPPIVPAPL